MAYLSKNCCPRAILSGWAHVGIVDLQLQALPHDRLVRRAARHEAPREFLGFPALDPVGRDELGAAVVTDPPEPVEVRVVQLEREEPLVVAGRRESQMRVGLLRTEQVDDEAHPVGEATPVPGPEALDQAARPVELGKEPLGVRVDVPECLCVRGRPVAPRNVATQPEGGEVIVVEGCVEREDEASEEGGVRVGHPVEQSPLMTERATRACVPDPHRGGAEVCVVDPQFLHERARIEVERDLEERVDAPLLVGTDQDVPAEHALRLLRFVVLPPCFEVFADAVAQPLGIARPEEVGPAERLDLALSILVPCLLIPRALTLDPLQELGQGPTDLVEHEPVSEREHRRHGAVVETAKLLLERDERFRDGGGKCVPAQDLFEAGVHLVEPQCLADRERRPAGEGRPRRVVLQPDGQSFREVVVGVGDPAQPEEIIREAADRFHLVGADPMRRVEHHGPAPSPGVGGRRSITGRQPGVNATGGRSFSPSVGHGV